MKNKIYDPGYLLSVVVTKPDTPSSGDPVRCGTITGVAVTDEGDGGNATGYTTVDFGPGVYDVEVTDGSGGIAIWDPIYLDANATGLSDTASDYLFGYALETVAAGETATIKVFHHMKSASALATLEAKGVAASKLADDVYQDIAYCVSGEFDNQTVNLVKLVEAGTVVGVTYFSAAALGASAGIDVVDGGAAGTGTDVICSCTDNLNGKEAEDTFDATHKVLAAGDWINLTFDDFTAATFCSVVIIVRTIINTIS